MSKTILTPVKSVALDHILCNVKVWDGGPETNILRLPGGNVIEQKISRFDDFSVSFERGMKKVGTSWVPNGKDSFASLSGVRLIDNNLKPMTMAEISRVLIESMPGHLGF